MDSKEETKDQPKVQPKVEAPKGDVVVKEDETVRVVKMQNGTVRTDLKGPKK